jgi:outer membrane protein assembly factor BamD (BamD/ComL family)
VEKLIAEGRPQAVKEYLQRAIEKWEIIINQRRATDITPAAYTFAAQSYNRMGDFKKALEYFTTAVERFPDYTYADFALCMVSRMCRQLQKQGVLTESEAWPMMLQSSQMLLNRYPRSRYVPVARGIVDRITATEIRRKELAHEQ